MKEMELVRYCDLDHYKKQMQANHQCQQHYGQGTELVNLPEHIMWYLYHPFLPQPHPKKKKSGKKAYIYKLKQ